MNRRFLKRMAAMILSVGLLLGLNACGTAAENSNRQTMPPEPAAAETPAPKLAENIWIKDDRAEISGVRSGEDLRNALENLAQFPALRFAEVSFPESSLTTDDLKLFSVSYPDTAILHMVSLSEKKFSLGVSALGVSELTHEDVPKLLEILPLMKNLTEVDLGEERRDRELKWEDIAALEKAAPDARFEYSFSLYGKNFRLTDTEMSLHHIPIPDEGELVRKVISCMPELAFLDMDSTGVSDESMAKIKDDFPDVKVVWRVWFGENYSVRTDAKKILASCPGTGGNLTVENTKALKYCTEVKYLDIGHNEVLHDISFISCMPDLEVAILAMDYFSDTSPIADCPNLEFLEIQTNEITDLSPLSGLKKLKHLNIAHNPELCDITPLYGLTQLERLWIGSIDPVPIEQVEEMQRRAPDCIINTTVWDPHEGNWRYDGRRESGFSERYELLVKQFGYDSLDYSYYWMDPYYYEDGRIPWRYMDSVYDD